MSQQWYVSVELHREITTWEEFPVCFNHAFSFVDVDPMIHSVLKHICDIVLKVVPVAYLVDLNVAPSMQSMMEFYNVMREPEDEDDPRNVNIPKSEESQDIAAPEIPTDKIN